MRIGKTRKTTFTERMNEAMQRKHMRNADIVEASYGKLSSSAVAQYRTGIYEPKAEKLSILARVLDVTEAWLLGRDETELTLTEHEKQLIFAYRQLNNEDKKMIDRIIKIASS